MRPVSRENSRCSFGGGATCLETQFSLSALDKNSMTRHLLEGNPVDEGTTLRGTDTPVYQPEKNAGSIHSSKMAFHPVSNSRGKWSSIPPHKTRPDSPVPTPQGPCDRSHKWRGSLRFLPQLEMRHSTIAPNPGESREAPPNSTVSPTSQRHPEKLPEVIGKS